MHAGKVKCEHNDEKKSLSPKSDGSSDERCPSVYEGEVSWFKMRAQTFRTRLPKPVNARKHGPNLVYHPKCKTIKEIYSLPFLSLSGTTLDSAGETEVDGGEAG